MKRKLLSLYLQLIPFVVQLWVLVCDVLHVKIKQPVSIDRMEITNVCVHSVGRDDIVMKVRVFFCSYKIDCISCYFFPIEYFLRFNVHFSSKGFEVTIPHFNRQSYFELKFQISTKPSENQLLRIDLIFASEHQNGLLLYADDKLTEFYFIISIRNRILDITYECFCLF